MSDSRWKYVVPTLLFALLAALVLARALPAQVATVKAGGKLQETVAINQTFSEDALTIYTVPAGKRLIVTDIVVANGDQTDTLPFRLIRNQFAVMGFILVQPQQNFAHSFTTGIEYGPGTEVRVHGDDDILTYLSVYGYLTK
jgi:hypothetical protein